MEFHAAQIRCKQNIMHEKCGLYGQWIWNNNDGMSSLIYFKDGRIGCAD